MNFPNIIEYPFFVSSELSNGVQLADLVAYSLYYTFKHNRPDYSYLDRILPRISRHKDDRDSLTGLKIWPDSGRFSEICNALQRRICQSQQTLFAKNKEEMMSGWANHIKLY